MKKLRVPFFKQDTGYSCGPTSLEMMMAYFGVRVGERRLSKRMKTNSEQGTRNGKIISEARREGFYCYVNDGATVEEINFWLGRRLPVLVNYIEPASDTSHYAVVVGIGDGKIIMNDPWNGKGFMIKIPEFVRRWTSEDRRHQRWLLVISKSDLRLGRMFTPLEKKHKAKKKTAK